MNEYVPEKKWSWDEELGGKFGGINRPSAGARSEKNVPRGKHPFQLYSLATPNGVKVTIMFEELLARGIQQAQYNAHLINILELDQFCSGFVNINPNSKIPALVDTSEDKDIHIFESGAILLYLADKFKAFIPNDLRGRTETLNWLFWQMGSAPYLGGGFGHFYNYAPVKLKYPIDRFTMETKRQLDVLDQNLNKKNYIAGDEYTIADMAIWPWYGALVQNKLYDAGEFLDVRIYKNLQRWADQIRERKAVRKGRMVNRTWGDEDEQVHERHSDIDFECKAI